MGTTYTHVISTVWITNTDVFWQVSGQHAENDRGSDQRHRMVINRPATMRENPMRKFQELSSAIQWRT